MFAPWSLPGRLFGLAVLVAGTVSLALGKTGVPAPNGNDAAVHGRVAVPPSPSSPDTLHEVNRLVERFTNQERRQRDLNRLESEEGLRRVACQHSADMLRRTFFRHENPDGEGPSDRVAKEHRRLIGEMGENIWGQTGSGADSPEILAKRIVDQLMNSPPHRENILRPPFTHIGMCVLKDGSQLRGTQMFARGRAFLASPLPRYAAAGSTIEVRIEQTVPPDASIAKYDFWHPDRKERVAGPFSFTDSLRMPQTTGELRTRFYVPESGRYSVHQGPQLTIRPPD